MAKTDHALKRLFLTTKPEVLISWMLGTDVRSVVPVSIEHIATPDPIRSDLVFLVTLADERTVLMPIEFQGHGSHKPVPLRVLDYVSRIVINERPDILLCVMCYVEEGAGRDDTGHYVVAGIGSTPTLSWNYHVIRLWEIDANDLLKLNCPVLIPLIGLTHMDEPEQVIHQMVEQLKQVPDKEERELLSIEVLALMPTEGKKAMTKQLLEREHMIFRSPYLEEIREEGVQEGIDKGIKEGIEKGRLLTVREYILDALVERFNPTVLAYRDIEHALGEINDYATLRSLFRLVLRATTVDEFTEAVATSSNAE